jgi:UDP-glucose 4-epimerase
VKYLVTGGAGFIGSHLVDHLLEAGHSVWAIDNLATGKRLNIAHLEHEPNFTFIEHELSSFLELDEVIQSIDGIFHLAATVGVKNVLERPLYTAQNNLRASECVLELAAKYSKKVVFTSSSEVYGKSTKTSFAEDDTLFIAPPDQARWVYATTKIMEETLVMSYVREKNLPATVVRLFNTVGDRQSAEYGMVIPRFLQQALKNQNLIVYGDGTQRRCFVYVKDVVRGLYQLMQSSKANGQVVNLGSTENVTIAQLAELVIKKTNSNSNIEYVPYSLLAGNGYDDIVYRQPDLSKAKQLIGFQPKYVLSEILEMMLQSIS